MARIRYIKPDFFLDEHLAELPFKCRLAFAGLWCCADKAGRLEDSPRKLKVQIFPYDSVNMDDVLQMLCEKPFIARYEVDGKRYIQILNFTEHQKPHHTEKESDLPEFNGYLTVKEPCKKGRNGDGDGNGNGECLKAKPSKPEFEEAFLKNLQENPAYRGIDLKTEFGKMDAWLLLRPGRKKTKRFIVNWLNRVESPVKTEDKNDSWATPFPVS